MRINYTNKFEYDHSSDDLLECVHTKMKIMEDKMHEARVEDREDDAEKYFTRMMWYRKMVRQGIEYAPRF